MIDTPRTLAQLAQESIDVQDACNLSGVAQSFGRAMLELRQHVGGGDALRQHPITLLWLDKLADMTGRVDSFDLWSRAGGAHDEVKRLAAGGTPMTGRACRYCGATRPDYLYVTCGATACKQAHLGDVEATA